MSMGEKQMLASSAATAGTLRRQTSPVHLGKVPGLYWIVRIPII